MRADAPATAARPPATFNARHRRNARAWVDFRRSVTEAYEKKIKVVEESLDALTAAAQVLEEEGQTQQPNALTRTWQHAVFGYMYSVPELNACAMYYGNALSRCEIVVGKRNPDGSVEQGYDGEEAVEGLDPKIAAEAADILATFRAKIGGQSELLRRYGELMFLVGELYFVPEDTPAGMVFECMSTLELKKEGKKWARYNGPGYQDEPLPEGTNPIRIWRPAPNYSKQSSSSVRAAMEILEELVVLTRLVRASAISRMALSGILAIADEFDFPEDEEGMDGDLLESTNPLATDMILTGAKAIEDPASAAAYMPYILQGPVDLIEHGIRHIPFQGDDNENVVKRREALERFAQGVDLPVEVVTGFEGTTYANAFQVNEDRFTFHFQPALQILTDAVTVAVLWPAMAKNRGLDPDHLKNAPYPDEILQVAATFSATKLISRPDRTKELLEAYKNDESQTAIANGELREGLGLDPEGGPDEEETARRLDAIRLTKERVTIQAPASDAPLPIGQADQAVVPSADHEATITAAAMRRLGGLDVRIAGAAELAAERALERIGAKLRSAAKGEQGEQLRSVSNRLIARTLGPSAVASLIGDEEKVLRTEAATFSRTVARWATEAGLDNANAVASESTALLLQTVRQELYSETANGHVRVPLASVSKVTAGV